MRSFSHVGLVAFLIGSAIAVAGCSSGPTDSGIHGIVVAGPTCPVERNPPDPNCADQPIAAKLAVTNPSGSVVATFSSGADGSYKVNLGPGAYIIRSAADAPMYPSCGPTEPIVVVEHRFTEWQVDCDTGIR